MKVLMVEDNKSVSEMMAMFFQKEDWDVTYAYDGEEAVDKFKKEADDWDIITLDLNLPKKDGMQVAKEIREISESVPIIMLTARDSDSEQVLGFEMGADDYVTKPFSPITLIARMKAVSRRSNNGNGSAGADAEDGFDVVTDNFKMNSGTREAYLNDQLIPDLTPKEFDLLKPWPKSLAKYLPGKNYYKKYGITNTMVMNGQWMLMLKNYVLKLKRLAPPKLSKQFGG